MAEEFHLNKEKIRILSEKKFEAISVAIRIDGLAQVSISGDEEIDVQHVKLIVDRLEELGSGKRFPLLILVSEYILPTPEARAYIASPESDPFASAEAYVIRSFPQKLVGNIYLGFNKPARPTRLFNNEEKAIEWLKTFLIAP
ncbi:MAG: hypothetical protein JWO44_2136 [Bacteroidetes bacterium]|nr:hypothetical protein [Bacteroidota bacterium]